ncbi:MAG TPA: PEGA domain-containing protein [Anaeromyxobacteraceae bacterium]|jgi:hypothetical protein|nr:PEGA domain-containing protein [Anaeromyxobacteraceae bacterium]
MTTPALLATLLLGAAQPQLAVVPLGATPQLSFTARRLAEGVAREVAAERSVEVMGPDRIERQLGRERAAELFACGANAHCLSALSALLGVDQVLGGDLAQGDTSYDVRLVLVQVKDEQVLAKAARELPIGSHRLPQEVAAAARRLLRGDASATGELRVLTDQPGARVTVDGAPAGRTPLTLQLEAGRHELRVSQTGFLDTEPRAVQVPAGGSAEERVTLQPIPRRGEGQGATRVEVSK